MMGLHIFYIMQVSLFDAPLSCILVLLGFESHSGKYIYILKIYVVEFIFFPPPWCLACPSSISGDRIYLALWFHLIVSPICSFRRMSWFYNIVIYVQRPTINLFGFSPLFLRILLCFDLYFIGTANERIVWQIRRDQNSWLLISRMYTVNQNSEVLYIS